MMSGPAESSRRRRYGSHLLCLAAMLEVACTSSKDLAEDGFSMTGGGYYEEEVEAGLYYVVARSTVGLVKNPGAARSMWGKRAEIRCKGAYVELEVVEYAYEPLPPAQPGLSYLISTRKGYALCEGSPLSVDEAKRKLDEGARIESGVPVS